MFPKSLDIRKWRFGRCAVEAVRVRNIPKKNYENSDRKNSESINVLTSLTHKFLWLHPFVIGTLINRFIRYPERGHFVWIRVGNGLGGSSPKVVLGDLRGEGRKWGLTGSIRNRESFSHQKCHVSLYLGYCDSPQRWQQTGLYNGAIDSDSWSPTVTFYLRLIDGHVDGLILSIIFNEDTIQAYASVAPRLNRNHDRDYKFWSILWNKLCIYLTGLK